MAERRAIFITGGGSGIGRAIALRFAHEGWFIGLGDVDEAGLAATEALLPGGFTYRHTFDVRNRYTWEQALKTFAIASGGRIDVVVNNAGVAVGGPLSELSLGEIDRVLDINLRGAIYGAQAALPFLKETAPGSCLLNTSSAAAIHGMPQLSVYGAAKAGLRSLTESLEAEWAPHGIRVRSLMPGFIDTPLLAVPANARRGGKMREMVEQAGLEFTPVEVVAQSAWDAIHGDKVHHLVGKTARTAAFAARWMPRRLRRRAHAMAWGERQDEASGSRLP